MIKKLNSEFEKLISTQSSSELYVIFFRLVQFFAIIGTVYFLFFVAPMIASLRLPGETLGVNALFFVTGQIGLGFLHIASAEFALRSTAQKKFSGVFIGLVLCLIALPSWQFLFGLFGFYCFLNPDFQQKYLTNSPEYFQKILVNLGIHRINSSSNLGD